MSGTSVSGNNLTVNLTGVVDAQVLTLSFTGVTDVSGHVLRSVVLNIGFLLGDTTANGAVNSADVAQTKSQSGQPVTGANFREDVTADGSISASDISLVKSGAGNVLP